MLDRRFYDVREPVSLGEVERLTGASAPDGYDRALMFAGVAILVDATPACLSFCAGDAFLADLAITAAGGCFVTSAVADRVPIGSVALTTRHPHHAYAVAAARLVLPREYDVDGGIHPSANLEYGVVVSRGSTIGPDVEIGEGTRIGPGAVIGAGVKIGRNCRIGANAVIGFALVGDRVEVHAGAIIGEPGFGAAPGPRGLVSLPQLGRVILQDDVLIGANSCIDRGAWADTTIGERTKIDNLVHIGHNVIVGRDCVMAAYTGISGSCVIGDGCMFGGRAGVIDHISIGSGAKIGADAAVMKDVPAGESWAGSPARPIRTWLRQSAWLARASRRAKD